MLSKHDRVATMDMLAAARRAVDGTALTHAIPAADRTLAERLIASFAATVA